MSFFRSILLVSLLSLVFSLALHLLSTVFIDNSTVSLQGGYAVLTTNASVDDRAIRSLLEGSEYFLEGEIVSESSQWVLLDVFDSLEMVALDQYHSRVFPFDPRYDRYADKLKDIFINDGKRLVFLPLDERRRDTDSLESHLGSLLEDIPFSVEYFSVRRSALHFLISYGAASLCLLIILFITRKQNRKTAGVIALIPALSSLAWFGAAGIACAALFFAVFILLREPLYDLAANSSSKETYREIIFSYRFYWLLLPLFAASVSVLVIFSQLKLLFFLAVFAAAVFVFLFSTKIFSKEQKRFSPVMIVRPRFPELKYSLYMLPFAAAALFVLFSMPFMPAAYALNRQFDIIIDEQDYYDHLDFQAFFSERQMGNPDAAGFPGFFFGADGLPSMQINAGASQTANRGDFPPFPLKQLMEFFHDVNSGQMAAPVSGTVPERLSLLVLLLFLAPLLFAKKKKDQFSKINFGELKRFSAKKRFTGINWNSKTLYNGRIPLQLRKDA